MYTLHYRPPEILNRIMPYTFSADMWALGCTLYWIYTRDILFEGYSECDMRGQIVKRIGPPSKCSPFYESVQTYASTDSAIGFSNIPDVEVRDLIQRCIQWEPKQRITAREARCHSLIERHSTSTQPVPEITCNDRNLDLSANVIDPVHMDMSTAWLMEVSQDFKMSNASIILAMSLFHRILHLGAIPKASLQLALCASIWIGSTFRDQNILMEHLVIVSAKIYTTTQISAAIADWLSRLNFDLLATTPYDYLSSYRGRTDPNVLEEALEYLKIVAPIKAIFTRADIVATCVDMASGDYSLADLELIRKFYLGPGASLAESNERIRTLTAKRARK